MMRLLVDGPASGAWNMAVDETLLRAAEAGECWLRFYEWSEPTLSLGYFQSYDERFGHPASLTCPLVRRASGGGAIVHDEELTYTLALPGDHPLARDTLQLYMLAHEALARALAGWRIEAELCSDPIPRGAGEPFLCFSRRARGDVLLRLPGEAQKNRTIRHAAKPRFAEDNILGNSERQTNPERQTAKICGSAQRRRHGAIAQHGSLILRRSSAAPELEGLAEVAGVSLTAREARLAWQSQLESSLGFTCVFQSLSAAQRADVQTLAIEKYNGAAWSKRR
jgi:lipoate-protein ligase A